MDFRLSLPLLMVLTACSTTTPAPTTADTSTVKKCPTEYRVGSNIPTRECRAAMREEDRERTMEEMRNATRPGLGNGS